VGLIPLEFEAPGTESFELPPIFAGAPAWLDKPLFQATLSLFMIAAFWILLARKRSMVPSRGQFIGETAYYFLRNTIARDMIGHGYQRYLPYLIALFSFVLVNNLWGVFPLSLFPTASHVGYAYGLAAVTWVLYNAVGIAKHGPWGYLKHTVLPPGVPVAMWPIVIPIEFASNVLVRPVTLSLRLFANMFAGHLLVLVFVLGGEYLLLESEPIFNKIAGAASLIFSLAIFGLELVVQILQAYIFTVLTAQYVSTSLSEEH
jgi:F-type H+-transporting ATPase subunit a